MHVGDSGFVFRFYLFMNKVDPVGGLWRSKFPLLRLLAVLPGKGPSTGYGLPLSLFTRKNATYPRKPALLCLRSRWSWGLRWFLLVILWVAWTDGESGVHSIQMGSTCYLMHMLVGERINVYVL